MYKSQTSCKYVHVDIVITFLIYCEAVMANNQSLWNLQ